MLVAFSANFMIFADRMIVSHYSVKAMNAIAYVGMLCAIFQLGATAISSIAEVFVGQYNGAKEFQKASIATWQMIWFSLMTVTILWPMALFGGDYILEDIYYEHGIGFYRVVMFFSFLQPAYAALSAFFIATGNVRVVTFSAVIGNSLNIGLDYLLVYGWSDQIPAMGPTGAGIATIIASALQVVMTLTVFLSKRFNDFYNTRNFKFDNAIFRDCIRLGRPSAIGRMIEIYGWSIQLKIIKDANPDYDTIVVIGQSIYFFVVFGIDGLHKGIIAITSNLIGGGMREAIPKLINSALLIFAVQIILMFALGATYGETIVALFMEDPQNLTISLKTIVDALRWALLYFIFDGLAWIYLGVLTAGGDTKYSMLSNTLSIWAFCILPLYIITQFWHLSPETSWKVSCFYSIMHFLLFYFRFKSGNWAKVNIYSNSGQQPL
jgi:MATE family multidrug resistance protein